MSMGAGSAWSCVTDLTMPSVQVRGRTVVAQAIARRLGTPRGGLIDDPNYGFDVTDYLNDDLGPGAVGRIESNIVQECLKDERVVSAVASVVLTGGVMIVTIQLTDASGTFTLVLSAADVSVAILKVTP